MVRFSEESNGSDNGRRLLEEEAMRVPKDEDLEVEYARVSANFRVPTEIDEDLRVVLLGLDAVREESLRVLAESIKIDSLGLRGSRLLKMLERHARDLHKQGDRQSLLVMQGILRAQALESVKGSESKLEKKKGY